MKKIFILLLLFIATQATTSAQDSAFVFYKEVPYPVTYFATNLSGELYTVNQDNLLKKYNTNGDSVGVFNDVKKYGRLSYVEAKNPWKTLLFYQHYQTIVILDKYLKNIGSINLSDRNIYNVRAVTTSYDNNIWVFDGRDFKIKKIDGNGRLLMASNDLRQVFDEVPTPEWIGDSDGLLYLYDPRQGFYIFDYYGAFKTMLPLRGWKSITVVNKDLFGFDADTLFKYSPPMPLPSEKPLPPALRNSDLISFSGRQIFVLKNRVLSIYNLF